MPDEIAPAVETPATPATPPATPPKVETPAKPPPSAKDWGAVTEAEKRARRLDETTKTAAKALEAEKAAVAEDRAKNAALREAYKSGDYSKIEAEFPDLYRNLTQAKLKGGKPDPSKVIEDRAVERIRAERAAEQKAAEAEAEKTAGARFDGIVETFATFTKTNAAKYPLLAVESEDDPELIRNTLRGMDAQPRSRTADEAATEMETWLRARLERRQKALTDSTAQAVPKTETRSPQEAAGQASGSGGPTTLTSRLSQETSLPAPGSVSTRADDGDPVSRMRNKRAAEREDLERATADFVARTTRPKA